MIYDADFTAVSQQSYWPKYNKILVENCKEGSTLLLNTVCKTVDELNSMMPQEMRKLIAQKKLKVMLMDASAISAKAGLPGRINSAMQTAFFMLSGVLPVDKAIEIWKKTIVKTFTRKGQKVVDMNIAQVDMTMEQGAVFELKYPDNWGDIAEGEHVKNFNARVERTIKGAPEFIRRTFLPIALGQSEHLPVSAFDRNGEMMTGTTKYFKRGIATEVPVWNSESCIQCLQCAVACPHAVIRPYLADESETSGAPLKFLDAKNPVANKYGKYKFAIQASPLDCTGCAVCVKICPKPGTLTMTHIEKCEAEEEKKYNFTEGLTYKAGNWSMDDCEKAFAFRRAHFEFHGACGGCGETAYITNLTRLYGSRMIIANATGCSSIYGFSYPYSPFATDEKGHGPAWANSLFEDNAEFGMGMVCAISQRRDRIKQIGAKVIAKEDCPAGLRAALKEWIEHAHEIGGSEVAAVALKAELEKINCDCPDISFLKAPETQEIFAKPVMVIIGGDGWAYDIGYGGLDHIMASGLDFTLLVLDTEVYSNTGGQRSKATPLGAIAKFAAAGKRQEKKDLAAICMAYNDAYVASVNLGANFMHTVKTLREAVEYNGPSLIIAYSPCIEHGMRSMAESITAEKLAA